MYVLNQCKMTKDIIRLHPFETADGSMIAISFPMAEPYKTVVKQLSDRRWCPVNKWVYVRNTAENLREIFSRFKGIAWIDSREYFNLGKNCKTEVRIVNSIKKRKTYIHFPFGAKSEWVEWIRKIEFSYHIVKTGDWAVPGNNDNFLMIKRYFIAEGCQVNTVNIDKLTDTRKVKNWHSGKPVDKKYLKDFENMLLLKRVSPNTSKIYISMFRRFLAYFNGRDINILTKEDITTYLLWEIQQNHISLTVQNQMINAIKYYFEKVTGKSREIYDLPRPKSGRSEPLVLNTDELQKILTGIVNIKHRCIISLIFSAGLRRQELINLKVSDIDVERKTIYINKGKGSKDRITILADLTAKDLHDYIELYRPGKWLFEGQKGDQYSAESIWKIFDRLKKRYNIEKKGNVHLLRHTFATNLLEAGTDIRLIQKLLGHRSLKTTEIYTHIANNNLLKIKSPIDQIGI